MQGHNRSYICQDQLGPEADTKSVSAFLISGATKCPLLEPDSTRRYGALLR